MTDAEFIEAARALYGRDGAIEIDAGAAVSRGADHGAYVQAWVWVEENKTLRDMLRD